MENQIILIVLPLVIKWIQTIFFGYSLAVTYHHWEIALKPLWNAIKDWIPFAVIIRYIVADSMLFKIGRLPGFLELHDPVYHNRPPDFSAGKMCIVNFLRSVSISFKDEPSLQLNLLNHHWHSPRVLLYETGSWRKSGAKTDSLANDRVQSTVMRLRSLVGKNMSGSVVVQES